MADIKRWYERFISIEPGVSLGQWTYDRITQNWATITAIFVSGGGMSYLAGITAWLKAWGPIVWGIGFFLGVAAFFVCRLIYEKCSSTKV